ncbi:hypothetical protein BASA50_005530 [Batrachochytrium salamandrivorans]|uniref:EGF-like domain-containing protein n=1 Tax=Batrachochytrium salamandrivorans TaxID=1357716 RepID=A0ABQ8FFP5_9FUNG|nr:hypothetical protein BASA50_005530 [Batrachochytrium salamandrivorans]
MLSRLIITFLCAAAIGSVSGAFLTFDPDPVVLKDTDISTGISVQLKSKPTEEVTVYFESPSTFMSTCVIVFDPNSWNVPQKINVMPVPPPIGSSEIRKQPEIKSELLAKAVTVGSLPADLSSTDTLKITQASKDLSFCGISDNVVNTFDSLAVLYIKLGWYQMVSTGDLEVQILRGECGGKQPCFPAVVFRYGPTVMSLDVRGPVKDVGEYSMTQVTSNTSGIRYTPVQSPVSTDLFFHVGRGSISSHERENEVDAFIRSWGIKDENVLTNPDARSIDPTPSAARNYLQIPKDPQPKPVDPVLLQLLDTTYCWTTAATTTTARLQLLQTAATTTAATTSYYYLHHRHCSLFCIYLPSTTLLPPLLHLLYIHSHQLQASGSYVLSDKVKQAYLAKCRTLTDDMILDPTKEVIDQGNQIRKEYGFGNVTCINSCSGKGTCTDFGCACSPGFSGMDCSMDLTKANQYDPTVDQYRINVNITVIQEQMEQHSKLPGSVPYATPASSDPSDPSVDQSLASFVGSLPKPSTVSPHIAEESQSPSPDSYDDFQKPIISSAISLGSLQYGLCCCSCDHLQLLSTSIAHLVVECEQVTSHRIQSGLVPAIQKSRLRLLGRALDPGVENVYTWLRGGVLNGEADLDQRWLDGTVEHESMGTRHDNRVLAARLADFLQVAYRQYQSTLWKYHRDRLVEVG